MTHIDHTHDTALTSWVESANGHGDFPIQNLPFGIFNPAASNKPRGGVAIGDSILDLDALAGSCLLSGQALEAAEAARGATLNPLLALDAGYRVALRRSLSALLASSSVERTELEAMLHSSSDCRMHLPVRIGDYSDFYVGIHHATNIGKVFRPENPLLPNYKHVPIGYHGRASSIRVSGSEVRRPNGQQKKPEEATPVFAPSARLDYELEMGVWIGGSNELGEPIPIDRAGQHIAGLCLLNDWSARDIQAWEYQPLGPFLSKSFMSTISPWIVTAEALAPFRIAQPERPESDPKPLPYLWNEDDQCSGAYAIELEVAVRTSEMRRQGIAPHRLSRGPARNMYWTAAQMVTHHASNGCNLQPGDLLGTGTISAPTPDGYGSLLEITRGGVETITLPTGETRRFLEDGDELILVGNMHAEGRIGIGFGTCRGVVTPAFAP